MGRPIIVSAIPENKVELPFRPMGTPASDMQRAIVHVRKMNMVIPSIHSVFIKPSTRVNGEFVSLSRDEFMNVFKTAGPYLVEESFNPEVPGMMIRLHNIWGGEYEIHMFTRGHGCLD